MKKIILLIMCCFIMAADKIFISCEGNFYYGSDQGNGSLWMINSDNIYEHSENPIGEVVQSIYVHNDQLYIIVNGSSNIQQYNISGTDVILDNIIYTDDSGPREMIIHGNYLFFTNWYSSDVKKINLNTLQIESQIDMPGLPEDIILHNNMLYVSITMNNDWSDGSQVVMIDPEQELIVETYDVGLGPGELLVHNGEIYVSRTYYDQDWNAFYGTSKITSDQEIFVENYGPGIACGGGIFSYQNSVYRVYDGGIAKLDSDLQIITDTRIGNFEASDVYSVEVIDDYIYFGLSDFVSSDEVIILDYDGNQIGQYDVGLFPGDYDIWRCNDSIDLNQDGNVDIIDLMSIVGNVLDNLQMSECSIENADINNDYNLNVLDILLFVNIILND